jgi:AcrR family transcriptional regulator
VRQVRPIAPAHQTAPRLSGDERRGQILAAASAVIDAQGFLPISFEQVARAAGVSKALIYAYFPTQAALCHALLRRELASLAETAGKVRARRLAPLAAAYARLYFDHIAAHGVVLHTLLTDPALAPDPEALAIRDAMLRPLLRASRGHAGLTLRQRIASLAIILAIVEETGRLAHRGEMETGRARELCERLVLSALKGLGDPPPAVD